MAALDRTVMQASSWLKSILLAISELECCTAHVYGVFKEILLRGRIDIIFPARTLDASVGACGGSSEIRNEQGVLTGGF